MDGLDCIGGVELNVSCPNVKDGLTFGTHPGRLKELTAQVKKVLPHKPLIVKLSPNVEDITATARAAIEGGADVLSLVNTFTAMAIDIHKKPPRLANVTGGLSGPAIKPIALHLVSRVYRTVARSAGVPIIGMGGVQYWQDAIEFILAGATAVAIGTALFVDPATPNKICEGIARYMEKESRYRGSAIWSARWSFRAISRRRRRIRDRLSEAGNSGSELNVPPAGRPR